jgi:hypothetical protein
MKRISILISFAAALFAPGLAAGADYFQQSVGYTIRVRLDTANHSLTGTERISYTNSSPDTLDKICLHLYPNAFKSESTALLKDYTRRFNRTFLGLPEKYRGYLDISDVTVDGSSVTPTIDETVATIALPHPLLPGSSLEISLAFEEKIRRHLERAGFEGGQYDMAQWYPKVAVYDEKGFHADVLREGEYYGEFGTYDVSIEVPSRYVIAATGTLEEGDAGWMLNAPDGRAGKRDRSEGNTDYKTVRFRAENVHDFAWSASPDFAVRDTTWNGIEIRSFFDARDSAWRDSSLAQGLRAVECLSNRVGPYPYPRLSIVQGLMRGGMEYPMLVMDGEADEPLALHEVAHMWFYGALSNDERAEAWLDEGFATAQERWCLQNRYGPYGNTRDWKLYTRLTPQYTLSGRDRRSVAMLQRLDYGEIIATPAENFKHSYYAMVYQKASLMLDALQYVVGSEQYDKILKTYFDRWKFKHVDEPRFQSVCEEVSGKKLEWFFEEWLDTRKICDYRLAEAKSAKDKKGDGYVTQVRIERLGELTMPLLIRFAFADGKTDTVSVSGRLRTIEKTFPLPKKPRSVAVNPDNEILDINLTDNSLPRRYSLQIDWPRNDYYPEDSYQIRHHPFAWYNDVDGARLGYVLKGSNSNWIRRIKLGVYYGLDSHRFDYSAGYEHPSMFFGNQAYLSLSAYKLEGRNDATIEVYYKRRSELSRPPTHFISGGFNYHEMRHEAYSPGPEKYQTLSDVAPYLNYEIDPQADIFTSKINLGIRFGREWFGGRYKYARFESAIALKSRQFLVPVDTRFRFFFGVSDKASPYQQKFYLAGGGPLAEEKLFFLRSPGAVPEDLNYHVGGHGNLRGYFEGDFGVNRLLAMNLELGHPIPLLSSDKKSFLGRISATAFADVGWSFDSENPIPTSARIGRIVDEGILDETICDAGVGFTLARDLPFWDLFLRLDLPFYVNQPAINGETKETDERYVFSLTSAF